MEEEFLKSIDQYQGILLKVCRIYCTDNNDAEDLFQEIILQLWKSWPTFNSGSKISTWIYRIGLNTAITRLRKNKRQPYFQTLSVMQNAIPDSTSHRIDVLYDNELQFAISQLNKLDKALVMLYLEEKNYKEIAEILGISESNVGVKINRIKKKLRENIIAEYGTR